MNARKGGLSAVRSARSALAARPRAFAALAGVILLVMAVIWLLSGGSAVADEDKPRLAYLSSLPLAFGEADIAQTLQGGGSADPFFVRLSEQYRLEAIDDLERLIDVSPDALLLIQPRAFSPHENVALDRWVRAGGELLFLADPALTRESHYPMGDKRRPLFTSMASPLFAHWGLELTLPMDDASPQVERSVDGHSFATRAPGAFRVAGSKGGVTDCAIRADGFVVRCSIGEGEATLIADADLVDPALWQERGLFGSKDGAVALIESYLAELAAVER